MMNAWEHTEFLFVHSGDVLTFMWRSSFFYFKDRLSCGYVLPYLVQSENRGLGFSLHEVSVSFLLSFHFSSMIYTVVISSYVILLFYCYCSFFFMHSFSFNHVYFPFLEFSYFVLWSGSIFSPYCGSLINICCAVELFCNSPKVWHQAFVDK